MAKKAVCVLKGTGEVTGKKKKKKKKCVCVFLRRVFNGEQRSQRASPKPRTLHFINFTSDI